KLAFADRERFYSDPKFVDVPLKLLLSKEYADERRRLIDPKKASLEMRPGHGPKHQPEDWEGRRGQETRAEREETRAERGETSAERLEQTYRGDTTHTCAIDIQGNMMAATCSGGWIPSSPVIPGLGFPMGTRGQMFYLDPHHASALVPRKRPRTT